MPDNVHHRVWEQKAPVWRPLATYSLLGAMVVVFIAQNWAIGRGPAFHNFLFTIDGDWSVRPWSLVTSTFAHGGTGHLFFNGLMFYFFGPTVERLLGRRDFVALFVISGAVAGILQVELSHAWGLGLPALGASGALMFIFGTMVVLFPNETILIYGIVPLKFWIAGILYAAMDVLGVFNPFDGIGNFAHLSGMALGLALGLGLRHNPRLGFRPHRRVYVG